LDAITETAKILTGINMKKFAVEGAITGTIYVSEEVYAENEEQALELVRIEYDKKYPFEINFSELEVQEKNPTMQLKVYFELHESKDSHDRRPIVGLWNENFKVSANIFDCEDKGKSFELLKNKLKDFIELSIFELQEEINKNAE
jgi:hypothetical protein